MKPRYALLFYLVLTCDLPSFAKRAQPKAVVPVVYAGVRYSAEGNGVDEYVVASEASTGKQLWTLKIAHNDHDPRMEQDVQDVFITDLKATKNTLLVRDEKSRCYSIDISTKRVNKQLFCHGF